MALKKTKVKKLFHNIGEVCRQLGETENTIKYWEREFEHLRPRRSPGGTRQYTEENIIAFRAVQRLIRERRLTIEGAKAELSKRRTSFERQEIALTKLRSALGKLQTLEQELRLLTTTTEEATTAIKP